VSIELAQAIEQDERAELGLPQQTPIDAEIIEAETEQEPANGATEAQGRAE